MSDCYIVRHGGGSELNFKIVGGTKPLNPKENTIWIDDPLLNKVGEYQINTIVAPTSRIDGTPLQENDVSIGWSGSVPDRTMINLVKKNAIFSRLGQTMVYHSGAWARKNAEVFVNGIWSEFSNSELRIFGNGVDHNKYIGTMKVGGEGDYGGGVTNSAISINVSSQYGSAYGSTSKLFSTKGFTALRLTGSSTGDTSAGYANCYLSTESGSNVVSFDLPSSTGTRDIDISKVKEPVHFSFSLAAGIGGGHSVSITDAILM